LNSLAVVIPENMRHAAGNSAKVVQHCFKLMFVTTLSTRDVWRCRLATCGSFYFTV